MRQWLILLFLCLGPAVLAAQTRWHLTLEHAATTFSSAAHDTSADPVHVRPWHPGIISLRLVRESGRVGYGLAFGYVSGRLAANIGNFVVIPEGTLLLLEAAPEFRYSIGSTASGASAWLHLGPVLDVWKPEGDDPRSAVGGLGGATLSLPVTGRWRVDVRADLAITGSEVSKDEASDEIIRESTMRRGRLALGLTRRL